MCVCNTRQLTDEFGGLFLRPPRTSFITAPMYCVSPVLIGRALTASEQLARPRGAPPTAQRRLHQSRSVADERNGSNSHRPLRRRIYPGRPVRRQVYSATVWEMALMMTGMRPTNGQKPTGRLCVTCLFMLQLHYCLLFTLLPQCQLQSIMTSVDNSSVYHPQIPTGSRERRWGGNSALLVRLGPCARV